MISSYCILLTVISALILDRVLAETPRFHPLVGFGAIACAIESRFYRDSRAFGVLALMLAILPLVLIVSVISVLTGSWLLDLVLLYFALGGRSLWLHAERVRVALTGGDLSTARERVACLVSRDVAALDEEGVARATVESVLENGNDAMFAALFWFVLAGAPGVVLYRLANTLDAMWGYRHAPYANFGWAAARLDDILNYIPARLTAFAYALAGNFRAAIACWYQQGNDWKSPNAGPVMASGAGSIGVVLGGPGVYHGKLQSRPLLGSGRAADARAIGDAQSLIQKSLLIWVIALFFMMLLLLLRNTL